MGLKSTFKVEFKLFLFSSLVTFVFLQKKNWILLFLWSSFPSNDHRRRQRQIIRLSCDTKFVFTHETLRINPVIPKVCFADHWRSVRLGKVVCKYLFNHHFVLRGALETFYVVRAPKKFGNHWFNLINFFGNRSAWVNLKNKFRGSYWGKIVNGARHLKVLKGWTLNLLDLTYIWRSETNF